MFFQEYRRLGQRARAFTDGKLVTYHLYVGGATLVLLGSLGVPSRHHAPTLLGTLVPGAAVTFGAAAFLSGLGLQCLHRRVLDSPRRDTYLATLTLILGRHSFPLVPSLFGALVAFSAFATVLLLATAH